VGKNLGFSLDWMCHGWKSFLWWKALVFSWIESVMVEKVFCGERHWFLHGLNVSWLKKFSVVKGIGFCMDWMCHGWKSFTLHGPGSNQFAQIVWRSRRLVAPRPGQKHVVKSKIEKIFVFHIFLILNDFQLKKDCDSSWYCYASTSEVHACVALKIFMFGA
jgi:hypothetical protein